MINHRQLEAFNAVVAMGTTVKAAELLGISQPAISRLIKQLELETKLQLFDRNGGRMYLTREGSTFHREVDRSFLSLRKLELIAHEIRAYENGQLRVGALPALGFSLMPEVAAEFVRNNPNIVIKMETTSSATIRDLVANSQFDMGFVADEVDISGLVVERFAAPPVVCIMPRGHKLTEKSVITPQDLENEAFISLSSVDRTRRRIDLLFEKLNIHRRIVLETHFALSVCQMVAKGVGIGLINPYSLGSVDAGAVVARAFSPRINFNTMMVYPPDRALNLPTQAFRKIAHKKAVAELQDLLISHRVIFDDLSRQTIGEIASPGPWIRNPKGIQT